MSDLTCLSKRDFLLLLCWVSTFLLYAPSFESIVVILSSMCMVPRFLLIDSWLWYDLFSNYLFLVTLWNFKGVLAFMFCYLMDKLNTTLCFFYALDNHFTFHALYTLSFVWLLFMISAWFLSSLQCYIYHVYVIILWSQLYVLLQLFDQGCVIACHLKNYFCYHLPTRDEQELSLGMLIRCKRIYNFWCSMLVLLLFLHVLCELLYAF